MALELLQGNLLELTFSDQQPQAILYAPSQLYWQIVMQFCILSLAQTVPAELQFLVQVCKGHSM